jgi:hypothetical protein
MAYRQRVGHALYITAAGTFQTWYRDRDDKQIWKTLPTLDAAIDFRDRARKERELYLQTPRAIRVIQRMAEHLNPPTPDPRPEWMRQADWELEPPDEDVEWW